MKYCPKCNCGGRIRGVVEKPEESSAQYICPNPACSYFRTIFAEETLPKIPLLAEPAAAKTMAVSIA